MSAMNYPPIVSEAEWLEARTKLLEKEKELTREYDRVNAMRRRLPMVELTKEYHLTGPEGEVRLSDLFEGQTQLIVYHFMFDPEWEQGCSGCTGLIDSLGKLSMLGERSTTFCLVSRAPLEKLNAYKLARGWTMPWYSSFGSDFNYDFHVTQDRTVVPLSYNYRSMEEMQERAGDESYFLSGETPGMSVFFRVEDRIYHTYSTYARGLEGKTDAYSLLDLTPWGRQEDFEDSPEGWPQKATYG